MPRLIIVEIAGAFGAGITVGAVVTLRRLPTIVARMTTQHRLSFARRVSLLAKAHELT